MPTVHSTITSSLYIIVISYSKNVLIAEAGKVLAQKVQGSQTKRHRRFRTLSGGGPRFQQGQRTDLAAQESQAAIALSFPFQLLRPRFQPITQRNRRHVSSLYFNQ